MRIYSDNPMTYAGALDVNIYIKRDFAPLEDRVRSVIAILNQAPQIMSAARANLVESLPRPQVETAIEEAEGTADFLGKDLVAALKDVTNESLMAEFNAANQRAIDEVRGYAAYLKEQKLPQGQRPLRARPGEVPEAAGIRRDGHAAPRSNCWRSACANCSASSRCLPRRPRQIDPAKPPIEVFRAIQKDHPTEQSLIPDTAQGPGHDPAVCDRPPDHHHSVAGPRQGGGDPAVHARHQLRLDGHARAV